MTVKDLSKLTGVSIRTLRYYDTIGLLPPSRYTQSGYRIYDKESLERLQQILFFKELEFPLKEIKRIIDSPDFDKESALNAQIELLRLKKEHFESLIDFALKIKETGVNEMKFEVFKNEKLREYEEKAKAKWGNTAEYKEFEEKTADKSDSDRAKAGQDLMKIFSQFAEVKDKTPDSPEAQKTVKKLQDYISENFYNCSDTVLKSLGEMYASGGEFTQNIDNSAGEGIAVFVAKAIDIYCKRR